jgi:hypothetical protein
VGVGVGVGVGAGEGAGLGDVGPLVELQPAKPKASTAAAQLRTTRAERRDRITWGL